jgi:CHAD domain-containing protein
MKKFVQSQTRRRQQKLNARLHRAARHPRNVDAIHDLRVAIRRLRQCLVTFQDFFAPPKVKKLRKKLGKLMDVCGEVRNADVAAELLRELGVTGNPVAAHLKSCRREAEKKLVRKVGRWKNRKLEAMLKAASPAEGEWARSGSVEEHAHRVLPSKAAEWFAEGLRATAPGTPYDTIHKFRLHTKGFRYTLELFERVYAGNADYDAGLSKLRRLQDKLGALNDCVSARELLKRYPNAKSAVEELLARREDDFRTYWRKEFGPETLNWWQAWLAGSKGTSDRYGHIHLEARRSGAARDGKKGRGPRADSEGQKSSTIRADAGA